MKEVRSKPKRVIGNTLDYFIEQEAAMSTRLRIMLGPAVLLWFWYPPAWALDIGPLLDTCPQHDPVYSQMRSDVELRRNGVPVQDTPCSEPISQRPISQYTDELIGVLGLRAVFYMLGSTCGEPLTEREDFGPFADAIAFTAVTPLTRWRDDCESGSVYLLSEHAR